MSLLVLFEEKLSFPVGMVSVKTVKIYIQDEQPTLAKLKIILRGHLGVACYIFFVLYSRLGEKN